MEGKDIEEEPLDFFLDHLTPAMREMARIELNETDEVKANALKELRGLITEEKTLVCPMNEEFLLRFLRPRKFDVQRTFKLIQQFFKFRERSVDFDSVDPKRIIEIFLKNYLCAPRWRDRDGAAIFIFKVGKWNPKIDNINHLKQVFIGAFNYAIQFPASQVCGFRIILDCKDLSMTQVNMDTPANLKLLLDFIQSYFPARFKGFHLITNNKLYLIGWEIAQLFLTKKIKSRVMFHGSSNLKPLLDYIHPSVLPVEYGGEADPIDMATWKEKMNEGVEYLLELLKYGYKNSYT